MRYPKEREGVSTNDFFWSDSSTSLFVKSCHANLMMMVMMLCWAGALGSGNLRSDFQCLLDYIAFWLDASFSERWKMKRKLSMKSDVPAPKFIFTFGFPEANLSSRAIVNCQVIFLRVQKIWERTSSNDQPNIVLSTKQWFRSFNVRIS